MTCKKIRLYEKKWQGVIIPNHFWPKFMNLQMAHFHIFSSLEGVYDLCLFKLCNCRSFHEMWRTTQMARVPKRYQNGPVAKLWNGKGGPLPFVTSLTSHEMICYYIVWIDRDQTLLLEMKRYENGPVAKLWNGKGGPLPFVSSLTSHEMICN